MSSTSTKIAYEEIGAIDQLIDHATNDLAVNDDDELKHAVDLAISLEAKLLKQRQDGETTA